VYRLIGCLFFLIGAALIGMVPPIYDYVVRPAWTEGGLLASFIFLSLVLTGGIVFIIVAFQLWRRRG
jgi:hypothetical protein